MTYNKLDTLKSRVKQLSPEEQYAFMLWIFQQTNTELLKKNLFQQKETIANTRRLLAIRLYEIGELTTGQAARLAGVPRSEFFFLLGSHNLSPFGIDPNELEQDLANAEQASYHQ
ncbi:UPF0175 family protein [Anaerolineales bacterium HSG24]|nr:UPF0175 family protein [Anaerolineales bacterium HSG24]